MFSAPVSGKMLLKFLDASYEKRLHILPLKDVAFR